MNYNSLLLFVIFVYSNAFSQEQLDYQCDFYDNGIAVSNGASMQVPYSGSGVGYEWDTRKYPKTFFAEEWPWSQDPKYKFRSDDERWMVLDPKTDKEAKWANGKARWVCDEIIIPNWNDNDDKSNVTVDCTSKGGFGTFDVLKLNLKRLSATSVYVINDWVLVDFGTCKKLL